MDVSKDNSLINKSKSTIDYNDNKEESKISD